MPTQDAQALADQLLLGRYRVLETRGEGGFGTVYVCWDPRLMRRVAIKSIALKPHAEDTLMEGAPDYLNNGRRNALLKAALDETRTASMLPHPNIVQMIDFEYDDACAYIIMEYVEGASLAELLDATDDGLLTADEAACVVEGVCDALEFAHDNGVLHLDIKPDNIMVDMSGRVKLADFGMATLSSMTGYSGVRGGTVGYMPPEQASGGAVDVRTDVFAFACVMYEALCGLRPFAADTPARSMELVQAGAPDPCALSQTIDVRAADALLDALEADPDARTQSAAAFSAQIMPALGRPRQGRRSLADLVKDVLDDSRQAEATDGEPACGVEAASPYNPDEGVTGSAGPRAAGVLLRACGALVSATVVTQALWALLAGGAAQAATQTCIAAFLVTAALGLLVPQIASFAVPCVVGVACIAVGRAPLGAAVLLAGVAWWVGVGRLWPQRSAGAYLSCLAPASAIPLTPLVCGYLLPAGQAAATTAQSFLTLAGMLALQGHAPTTALVLTGVFWVGASAAQAAVSHAAGKGRCYLGALLGVFIIVAVQLGCARMENEGVWTALSPEALAVSLGSTILVALLIFAFGASAQLLGAHDDPAVKASDA